MTMTDINPFTAGQVLWTEYETYITKVARTIARGFWKIDEEDVLQEIHIFLWEKEHYFLEGGYSEAYIKTSIRNVAFNYALKERNRMLLETDKFYYHIEEVKELLPAFFSTYDSWTTAPVPEGAATMTRNDNVEIFCDFSLAWEQLNETQQDVLERKYAEDEDFTESKDRQALSRAVRRFVTVLNQDKNKQAREHTGPGSRKAITNGQGVYLAKKEVDD